jgi:hypothetical protein
MKGLLLKMRHRKPILRGMEEEKRLLLRMPIFR